MTNYEMIRATMIAENGCNTFDHTGWNDREVKYGFTFNVRGTFYIFKPEKKEVKAHA